MKRFTLTIICVLFLNNLIAQEKVLFDFAIAQSGIDWIKIKADIEIEPYNFFNEYQSSLGFDKNYSFKLFKQYDDFLGFKHYKYNQFYKGVRVEGGQYILHSLNNTVVKANGKLVMNIQCTSIPLVTAKQAIANCMAHINAPKYYWQDPAKEALIKKIKNDQEASFYPQPELVIADKEYSGDGSNYNLCWKIEIFAEGPIENEILFVDASNGSILYTLDGCVTGSATTITRYSGTQTICTSLDSATYVLIDSTRGGGVYTLDMNESTDLINAVNFTDDDNFWNNANSEQDDAATDAHWGMEMSYDYFLQKHNRQSFDDNDGAIFSYIHHDVNWFNAQWFGRMYARFGDGAGNPLTSIDVTAHELTHGITQNTSDLIYRNESGALNESFSDIFGSAVKNFALNDTGGWQIGAADFLLRDISNPNAFSDPDTYAGQFWAVGTGDNGGVHTNSGVQNYWYYLLAVGDTGTNDNGDYYDITGLGRDTAEAIAYRNTFAYLTQNSTYLDARQGSIEAAEDLYGTCSFEVMQTNLAWYAVGVGPDTLTQDISLISVSVPDSDCNLSANENLGVICKFNRSGCSAIIPAGDTIKFSYTLNGATPVIEEIVLANPLSGGDSINYTFSTKADLSASITHSLDFSVEYSGDVIFKNNTISNIEIKNPVTLSKTDFISFEKKILVLDSFYIKSGPNAEILVLNRASAPSSTRGLQFAGKDADTANIIIPTNQLDNFILNSDFGCKACFCVDASGWTNARMVFDLKQTFSPFYAAIGLGNIPEFVSSARILVNGTQIGSQYHPTSNDTDKFVNYIIDLDAFAGGPFEACFEGKHFINWQDDTTGGFIGDHTFLDNLFFTDDINIGLEEINEDIFYVYPNPGSGIFSIVFKDISSSEITLQISDLIGREVLSKDFSLSLNRNTAKMDLSDYNKGVYFLTVIAKDKKYTQRLILQ